MKIVHIESGLGNQMLGFAEYLAIKKNHPDEECYIETIIYEIPEASEYICQWNGYELDRVFGIQVPNVRNLFSSEQWEKIISYVRKTRFWEDSWNYPKAITSALNIYGGLDIDTVCVSNDGVWTHGKLRGLISEFLRTSIGYNLRRHILGIKQDKMIARYAHPEKIFYSDSRDLLCGFTLLLKYRGNHIELLDDEIRQSFIFPPYDSKRNEELSKLIVQTESVAVHIRRGDMVIGTDKFFRGGFYKRAIKYIRKNKKDPVFFIFSDPESIAWAKKNMKTLGLTRNDRVYCVDWNLGRESYRDMQLMSECKNCIFTLSSFSWWAAYLIKGESKITISPEIQINTTYHC